MNNIFVAIFLVVLGYFVIACIAAGIFKELNEKDYFLSGLIWPITLVIYLFLGIIWCLNGLGSLIGKLIKMFIGY